MLFKTLGLCAKGIEEVMLMGFKEASRDLC